MPVLVQSITQLGQQPQLQQQIATIYQKNTQFTIKYTLEELIQLVDHQQLLLYVAIFNRKIIGLVCSQRQPPSEHSDEVTTAYLQQLVIHPANLGRGIEQRLIQQTRLLEQQQGIIDIQSQEDAIKTYI